MSSPEVDPGTHERAFEAFADRATDRIGNGLRHLILFGSTARGEARGIASDVDVFAVVESTDHENELREIEYDVQLEYGVVLSIQVMPADRFERGETIRSSATCSKTAGDMSDEFVQEEFESAGRALEDAETMQRTGVSDEAIVNRLYYACFHAANAVLYDRGFEPETHQGTIMLFGRELVVDGEVPKEHGHLLNELRDHREQADYGHDRIDVAIDDLRGRAESFVEAAERSSSDRRFAALRDRGRRRGVDMLHLLALYVGDVRALNGR